MAHVHKISLSITLALLAAQTFAAPVDQIPGAMAMHYQKVPDYDARYEQHYKKSGQEKKAAKVSKKQLTGRAKGSSRFISNVSITGNKSIPACALKQVISKYLSKGVTTADAVHIRNAIENYYKKQGYLLPVAYVTVNAKTISIKIIEGEIRDAIIFLDGKQHDKTALQNTNLLKLASDIEDASPLTQRQLERYILLINKIHGYDAEYEILPLDNPTNNEVADIAIKVQRKKGAASLSFDNNGLKEIGKYEFMANAQGYNVFSNDSLILNAGTSDKPNKFKLFGGGYLKRLTPYGTSLSVSASYSTDDPYSMPGSSDSKSRSIKGRFDQYLVINNDYSVKLEAGVDQRDVIYYAGNQKARDYKYPMGSIGGKIKIVDPFGSENWFYPYYNWTLKKVSYSTSSQTQRNFRDKFSYFVVDWFRTQFLTDNFSFLLRASYQYTDDNLPSAHLYGIGSHHTIKGYKVGLVSADKGVTGAVELRYLHKLKQNKLLDAFQLFGFYGCTKFIDHNKTDARTKHPGGIYFDKSVLQSFGGGLRFYFPYGFYGEYMAAQPLKRNIKIDGQTVKNKLMNTFLLNKEFGW